MKIRRIVSMLLILAMSLGLITGCGAKKKDTVKVEGLPDHKVTLSIGIPQKATVTDYDDNAFTN